VAQWTDQAIVVELRGKRLHGRYNLLRFPRGGKNAWLIIRAKPAE